VDGGGGPGLARGARHVLRVQRLRDGPRTAAGHKLPEDPADDVGFGCVDRAPAMDGLTAAVGLADHIVAVAAPSAGAACAHSALDPPPGLEGEVLEEERVHGALQAHMQLGDLAFGEGGELHAREEELLVECRGIFLVAGKTIERLCNDDVELPLARVFEEALIAGPEPAGAALRTVGVGDGERPTFTLDPRFAEAQLILDRGVALEIGRVAGVDGGAHGGPPQSTGFGDEWRRRSMTACRRRFAATMLARR